MNDFVVIVPSNRPDEMTKFFSTWKTHFEEHVAELVIMWDLPKVPETAPKDDWVTNLCWKDVKSKHIPKKTDMIRSWAFKYAYDKYRDDWNVNYFMTLDDDVRPLWFGRIFEAYRQQFQKGAPVSKYFSVGALTTSDVEMRGFPYKDRKLKAAAVQYGGWEGVLDYDAATQLAVPKEYEMFSQRAYPVPKGAAVTCCIMNTAWEKEYTPIMWQLPMLEGRYNRVGDIWSGLFIKKTLDALNVAMVINGEASVIHERASNPYNSLVKEAPSVWLNDNLWDAIDVGITNADSMLDYYTAYTDLAIEFFEKHDKEYAKHFKKARDEWVSFFK